MEYCKIKKLLLNLVIFSVILCSCNDSTDEKNESGKYLITIKNESSFPLTNVKFLNLSFATIGNDLSVSGHASQQITSDLLGKSGYITFEFKNTPGVTCRTNAWLTISENNLTYIFIDETIVEELNNSNNKKPLSQITFSRIAVERNGLSVIKNDIVSIGETVANFISQHEISIKNNGAGKLKLIGNEPVKINGSSDVFSIIQPSSSEINQSDILTFRINFMPKAVQLYSAQVIIASDDLNGEFTFMITATGTVPKPIAVINYLTTEVDQDGTINIDEVLITQSKMFNIVIKNIGTEILTIEPNNISITGADEAAFTKITNPGSSISINSQTSFNIEFKPTKEGENNVTLIIPTNDVSRNPIVVFIKGIGKKGKAVLQLTQGSTTINNNTITPFDFENAELGSSKQLIFTIKNIGNISSELIGEPIVDSSATAFAIQIQPAKRTINPNDEVSFIIKYTPLEEKEDFSIITILNNSDDMIYSFSVKGYGYIKRPQINIKQGNTIIPQNGEFNLGTVLKGQLRDIVFTIENSGEADLNFVTVSNNRINIEDNNLNYFSVIQQPFANTIVSSKSSTTFIIRFNPDVIGNNFTASVHINTNSHINSVFSFWIIGNCSNSYSVGDIGPGGGLVFFAQGGQYKEVSGDLGSYNWNTARTTANNFNGGGFTGWYLPDRGELDLIYEKLHRQGLGGFSDGYYWSSTISSSGSNIYYRKYFHTGSWYDSSSTSFHRVCAVRVFTMN